MKFISINNAVNKWLIELKYGREKETLRNLKNHLKRIIIYFDDDPRKIDLESYHNWIVWASNQWKPSTVNKTHKTAQRLFKWMKIKEANKICNIRLKVPQEKIETYSRDDIGAILNWCNSQNCDTWRSRCAAFLLIVSSSGMRGGEVIKLKWSDFDEDSALFHLQNTKTRVSRFAAVHPNIIQYLKSYKIRMNQRLGFQSSHIFPSFVNPGNGVVYTAVMNKIRDVVSKELQIKINAKKFRSTLVKLVIESGAGYERAAAIVGHTDIGTTQRHYHRISMDQGALNAHATALDGLGFDKIT